MSRRLHSEKAKSLLPIMEWLPAYQRKYLSGDLIAGTVVAVVLIPQAMAYAMVAGLPPHVGLYSCLLPIFLYALFGSSRTLAVGPVGLISLVVGSTIIEMGIQGEAMALTVAVTLALMSGVLLLLMRVIHLGSVINFISHPVLSGFTSAAALLIAFSQMKHLLGVSVPHSVQFHVTLSHLFEQLGATNVSTLMLGVGGLVIMYMLRSTWLRKLLEKRLPVIIIDILTRSGPLVVVVFGVLVVWFYSLNEQANVNIVGLVPAGLPRLAFPAIDLNLCVQLLPVALLISIVGYLESVSVSKALASRRRQKIDADQELFAHGVANLGAAFSGGYPTAGGFGRSMVNFTSGAHTPIASIVTVFFMGLALLYLTPLLYYLPRAVLAAIIIMAVASLIDFKTLKHAWAYDKADALSLVVTFVIVLLVGIEQGILVGACLSIGLYLHRSSKPHVAIVGRVGESEHYRNINRHTVTTCAHVIAMRIDENLYFANTNFLEDKVLNLVAEHQQVTHFVLICSAVNVIDVSALEALENIIERLGNSGVTFHLAEVKGPVMDRLEKTTLLKRMQPGRVFLSTHQAMTELGCC